jgi:hypothetical protein
MKFPETTEQQEKDMPTQLTRMIPVTNDQGVVVLDADDSYEPLPGSIIMTEGVHGTASTVCGTAADQPSARTGHTC